MSTFIGPFKKPKGGHPPKMGQFGHKKGAAAPRDWPLPYWLLSAPSFAGCFLPPLQRWLHGVSMKTCTENGGLLKIGRYARKHNSIPSPPSNPMTVWSKGCGEEAHGSLTWHIEWSPLLLTYKYPLTPSHSRNTTHLGKTQHKRHNVARRVELHFIS
jgi:hypothetical protein